jgi:hypothetical protein
VTVLDSEEGMACPATVTALDPDSGLLELAVHWHVRHGSDPFPDAPLEDLT